MARKEREAITIVLDVGLSVSEDKDQYGRSYLDRARSCASRILQRKLFGKSNDLMGLLLLGTEESNNSLDYPNIAVKFQMGVTSWDLLEFIEKRITPTKINADWLDAIVVGMQFIKDETEGSSFPITSKKLIIFTKFSTPVSDDQSNTIMEGLKSLQIELIVIGPNLIPEFSSERADVKLGPSESHTNEGQSNGEIKMEAQESGEALISRIITEVNGMICSFDNADAQLQYFETKKIRAAPWNVVMDIGPDIFIPVTGFKKISSVTLPTWKTESTKPDTGVECERSYFKQDAEQKNVTKEDVISGYTFGSTIVPFSGVDQAELQYQSGDKCLSVIGTTNVSAIPRHLLVGEGCHYIVAQKDDPVASVALSAFINGLLKENLVAIARKVYNNNNNPVIVVMYPKVRTKFECLVLVDLPYGTDVRNYKFPSLKKYKLSEPQLNCIDQLITNMDLTTAAQDEDGEAAEAFHPKHVLDPYHQHFYQALCSRGLNPDAPLPPVSQATLNLLENQFKNSADANNALCAVKENFKLTVITHKGTRKTAADIFKQEDEKLPSDEVTAPTVIGQTTMADITASAVVEIGTVNPVQDFKVMLEKDLPYRAVATEMGEVIINLVLHSFGSDDFHKAVLALRTLRENSVLKDQPHVFNDWLIELKDKILGRGKRMFWDLVVQEKLGQITSTEAASSTISPDTAAKFLTISDAPADDEDVDQLMDVDDLFDEL